VKQTMKAHAKFENQVKLFLRPVLSQLGVMRGYVSGIVNLMQQYNQNPSPPLLERIRVNMTNTANSINRLPKRIPTIQQSIQNYCAALEEHSKEEKKKAVAAFILMLPGIVLPPCPPPPLFLPLIPFTAGFSVATQLPNIAKNDF
jgi:hypothetical protein